MIELRQTVSASADAAYEAAVQLFNAGNKPILEVVQEQRAAAEARLELAEAESELVGTRERMNVLLGLWGDGTRWRIPPRLPELPAEELEPLGLEKQAVSSRYDLLQARSEIEALAGAAGVTDVTGLLADLTLQGHFEREPEGNSTFGPSIEFPLSIFNFGQGARTRARAQLRQATEKYAALAIEIRSDVRAAYAQMIASRRRAEYYRAEVLPLEQAAVRETQLQYNGMFLGVFHLLQAKRAQIETGKNYIKSLHKYWKSRAALEKALARTLPTGVTETPTIAPVADNSMPTHQHHH